ncbi:hypothetical protein Barb6_03196 [Bacteroidales bacterium Barb6]|nr:hypothetical protein Barb6_03196 [Bacteroidales bacterium Barb6]
MNKMKTRRYTVPLLAALLCLSFPFGLAAQKGTWEYKVLAGYNFGGTMPLPLPAEIRGIDSWSPGFAGTAAFHAIRWLTPEWGIATGLSFDIKEMRTKANVKYWQTNIEVGEGDETGFFSGTFSGRNETRVRNSYITVPVAAAFRPFEAWTFRLGGYLSFQANALFEGTASDGYIRSGGPAGDRINVENAVFDFSDKIRKYDAGVTASAERSLAPRLSATGQLSWGLVPVFPASFEGISYKMYNVYFTVGIGYRL